MPTRSRFAATSWISATAFFVEQPNGDFAQTMARQFLFSNWQELVMQELAAGPSPALAAIGAKAVKEVAYHARYASEWIVRLGDGTEEPVVHA